MSAVAFNKQFSDFHIAKPQEADWGTAAIFADPDGNQFVLGSP